MPSENAFKKQADVAADALKSFVAVQNLKSTVIVKAAMTEMIEATIGFNTFVPFFVAHPLFQEIPPAVHTVLEKFSIKNPTFDMPPGIAKVAGLDARARDAIITAKRGTTCTSRFLLSSHHPFLDAVAARVDKGVLRKPKATSVSSYFLIISFISLIHFSQRGLASLKIQSTFPMTMTTSRFSL